MITVLICDDQDMVREGLRAILNTASQLAVVGLAADGEQALRLVSELHPDVVVMDLKMPGMNGVQATREIRDRFPEVRVLILTTYDADEWLFDAIRSGACGYVLKDSPRERLVQAIEDTARGQTPVDQAVASKLFAHIASQAPTPSAIGTDLSERERDVLRLLARGLNNAEIARQLYLSPATVRNYVSAILTKLGVSDRTQAAVLALRHGLADTRGR